MNNAEPEINIQPHPRGKHIAHIVIFLILIIIGLLVRFFDYSDPPLDFHPTRQLHSLIIARGIYYQNASGLTEDQRQTAMQQSLAEGRIEPPILEWIVAQTYSAIGSEEITAARAYSILFWVVGGVLFYFLSRKYLSTTGRLIGLAFFLILPYGIYASRAFQPDPFMMTLCILSWFLFARWVQNPNWTTTLSTGLATGITLLIKTTAVFYLGGVFLGILVATRRYKILRSWQTLVMLVLFALPTTIYAVTVWFNPAASSGVTSLRFFPSYWTRIEFYLTWYNLLNRNIGLLWIVLSLIGGLCLTSPVSKGIYWGGLAGYLVMGFVLPHHISTHDYYILPLIPLLALGIAGLANVFERTVSGFNLLAKIVTGALLATLVLGNVYQARSTLKKVDFRQEPAFWEALAKEVGPMGPVVGITQDYGLRMTYWGGISISNWFTADEIKLRASTGEIIDLENLFTEKTESAGVFLVTLPEEFAQQPELKNILDANFPQVSTKPSVWIYDLRANKR